MLHLSHGAGLLGAVQVELSDHALAYIGPGAGLGAFAVAIALGLGVLLLVIGLVWYPLKRLLNGRTESAASSSRADDIT